MYGDLGSLRLLHSVLKLWFDNTVKRENAFLAEHSDVSNGIVKVAKLGYTDYDFFQGSHYYCFASQSKWVITLYIVDTL